jgi:hypothetical protein
MAATAKKAINVANMQRLLGMIKQRHEENAALIDELERIIGGGPTIGEILKDLYAYWIELWPHGGNYVFAFEKDTPHMKRLFRQLGIEELKARMLNFMRDNSDYVRNAKHAFPLFVATNNRYASAAPAADLDLAPVGCKHSPPCSNDQAHTKRVNAEMRA